MRIPTQAAPPCRWCGRTLWRNKLGIFYCGHLDCPKPAPYTHEVNSDCPHYDQDASQGPGVDTHQS